MVDFKSNWIILPKTLPSINDYSFFLSSMRRGAFLWKGFTLNSTMNKMIEVNMDKKYLVPFKTDWWCTVMYTVCSPKLINLHGLTHANMKHFLIFQSIWSSNQHNCMNMKIQLRLQINGIFEPVRAFGKTTVTPQSYTDRVQNQYSYTCKCITFI